MPVGDGMPAGPPRADTNAREEALVALVAFGVLADRSARIGIRVVARHVLGGPGPRGILGPVLQPLLRVVNPVLQAPELLLELVGLGFDLLSGIRVAHRVGSSPGPPCLCSRASPARPTPPRSLPTSGCAELCSRCPTSEASSTSPAGSPSSGSRSSRRAAPRRSSSTPA